MAWLRICGVNELPATGGMRVCTAGSSEICVANENGALRAIDNICPHRGGPLAEGSVEDGKVLCPWHAWAFDLKTGVADHNASEKVRVYPIRIEGEDVSIDA
jgi:nitrite reductase (NADH) small subunit